RSRSKRSCLTCANEDKTGSRRRAHPSGRDRFVVSPLQATQPGSQLPQDALLLVDQGPLLLDESLLLLNGLAERCDEVRVAQRQRAVRVPGGRHDVVAVAEQGLDVLGEKPHVGPVVAELQLVGDRTQLPDEVEAERKVLNLLLGARVRESAPADLATDR